MRKLREKEEVEKNTEGGRGSGAARKRHLTKRERRKERGRKHGESKRKFQESAKDDVKEKMHEGKKAWR